MQCNFSRSYVGKHVESKNWIAKDYDKNIDCIFMFVSIRNGEVLKSYYESLAPEDAEKHIHLRTAFNGLNFTDANRHGISLAIQHAVTEPIGLLLPMKSVEGEFYFDHLWDKDESQESLERIEDYSDKINDMFVKLDEVIDMQLKLSV